RPRSAKGQRAFSGRLACSSRSEYDFGIRTSLWIMSASDQPGKLTARDRRAAQLWQWAPWLAFLIVTVSPPATFGLASLLSATNATVYLLLAFSSFPFSLITAIIVATILLLFRRSWAKRVRERLASDGITADEVAWFLAELTGGERRALKEMERRQPLLADAYRETLALRLNASRLVASARRDLLLVDRRINRSRYLSAPDTAVLIEELGRDRARLEAIKQEGSSRRAEAEARLQMIEAAASRGASWAETNYMLQRLDEGRKHMPLGLEVARAEQQIREDTERELRKELTQ
ncbi:MAG TPA: hypothetical protein VHD88_06935, partial [Pyrinomonadaceae bacterium]|nr:hypothetical protein [Pyrinomonadaceae bacterium]